MENRQAIVIGEDNSNYNNIISDNVITQYRKIKGYLRFEQKNKDKQNSQLEIRGSNDITTHVGIGFSQTLFPISEIVANIRNNTALYYTYENNRLALIHARQRSDTGTLFLTIAADDHAPNNLDNMRVCPD